MNCDDTERIGRLIQEKLDGVLFEDVSFKKVNQVITLASLSNKVTHQGKVFSVDPTLLFSRLILIMERTDDMLPYFKYELTSEPTSLFKDNMMRKSNKSTIIPFLLRENYDYKVGNTGEFHHVVVDGGFLLRKVVWPKEGTYETVIQRYISYVSKRYKEAYIVFDGYNTPSTKDHEHNRRANNSTCPDIQVESDSQIHYNQTVFFSNDNNMM